MNTMPQKPESVRFPVFRDKKGNRFVFPGLYTFEGHTARWMFCRQVCMALGVEQEDATLDVVPDCEGMLNFPRVVASAGSPGFRHGGSEVWLIGGPEYEAIEADEAAKHTPTIRPLEWQYFPAAFPNAWDAETPFGRYSVEEKWGPNVEPPDWHQDANSTWALSFGVHQTVGVFATLEAAKAAAQTDFEARVLAVLGQGTAQS